METLLYITVQISIHGIAHFGLDSLCYILGLCERSCIQWSQENVVQQINLHLNHLINTCSSYQTSAQQSYRHYKGTLNHSEQTELTKFTF